MRLAANSFSTAADLSASELDIEVTPSGKVSHDRRNHTGSAEFPALRSSSVKISRHLYLQVLQIANVLAVLGA